MEDIRKWKEAEGGSMEQEPKKYSLINYFTISLGGGYLANSHKKIHITINLFFDQSFPRAKKLFKRGRKKERLIENKTKRKQTKHCHC